MRTITYLFVGQLTACVADFDSDMIPKNEETLLGTDPRKADTDGDELDDLTETKWTFTDPLNPDSDGDGDSDGFEVDHGLDPLDEFSKSYTKEWPLALAAAKEAIEEPPPGTTLEVGNVLPRFRFTDVIGEVVDAYDFAGQGKPTILAGGYTGGASAIHTWRAAPPNAAGPSPMVAELILQGDVQFAVVATAQTDGNGGFAPPPPPTNPGWCMEDQRYCVSEESFAMWGWARQVSEPFWILLDESMTIRAYTQGSPGNSDFTSIEVAIPLLLHP